MFVKSTADKIILVFSALILLDLIIIGSILLNERGAKAKVAYYPSYSNLAVERPKTGFTELIAQAAVKSQVLSVTSEATPTPPPFSRPLKQSYVIAIIGDSMAETMGDSIDYVKASLEKKYPRTGFAMYNYGIGSENIELGLARFDKPFDHGTRRYAPLSELKPDILIVGSYAYNPLDPFDRKLHAAKLAELVNKARQVSGKVYLLAEVAPVETGFGTGPGGVNWPERLADEQVKKIMAQMDNVFSVGKELSVSVIDVYTKSKREGSIYGNPEYVGTHDHIHTSLLGQTFTANIITEALNLN